MSETELAIEKELFSACEDGDVDGVRRAIADGVDPKTAINKDRIFAGETPLHTACRYVHHTTFILLSVSYYSPEVLLY